MRVPPKVLLFPDYHKSLISPGLWNLLSKDVDAPLNATDIIIDYISMLHAGIFSGYTGRKTLPG